MSGKSIIVVGGTGTGKSTFIKDRLKKVHKNSIHLYDVNKEYVDFYNKPFTSFEKFAKTSQKISDGVLVYEEATIFLSNKGANDAVRDVLVRKRHTNNTIFFIFHSLRTVPRWIFDLSNFVVVFKTNDSEGFIDSRFENELLTACFKEVNTNPDKHYHKVFSIY